MKIISIIDATGIWLADFVLRRPWLSILLCALLIGSTAPGLPGNSMSVEHRDFFGPDNPQLVAYDLVEEKYTRLDNLLFVIRTEGQRALSEHTYPIISAITEQAWQLPAAVRVDSLSNYQHTYVNGDDLLVEDLLYPDTSYTAAELTEKEAIVLAEPLLQNRLISPDGTTTAVNVVTLFDDTPGNDLESFSRAASELASQIEAQYPGTRIALTGTNKMSMTFSEAGTRDGSTLIPGMYLILLVALLFVYRSVTASLTTMIVVTTSTIVPMGLMGYTDVQLTSISVLAPVIIMTLAVADSVHILVSMLNLMRSGMDKLSALRESLRINFLAVSVTSITTIIGFLCLNYSDSPPYQHLGNLSAIGIMAAWLFSVVLLPALLIVFPLHVKSRPEKSPDVSQRYMRSLALFTTNHFKLILLISFIGSVGLISQLPKLELNDQFVQFFDESLEFRRDTDFTQQHLGGIFDLQFDLQSGQENGISDPEYLRVMDEFQDWLKQLPIVTSVYSYSDIAKRLNRNMNGDDPRYFRVPEQQELAAQYLLLYELSLPYGLDLTDRIDFEKSGSRVTATVDNPTARQVREFGEMSRQWLRDNAPESMWAEPTGTSLLFSHISKRNIESMLTGNIIAVIAIAVVLILALNHFGLGLLSMLPNVLPVALALSLWSVFVGVAGMATTVVAASSLGIVVDNTTHFLSKYLRARRERGQNKQQAIVYSFETVGIAIIANGLVLMSGFMLLAFSNFQPNFQMGVLTALTIAIALIVDLICLPALLMVGGREHKSAEATETKNA